MKRIVLISLLIYFPFSLLAQEDTLNRDEKLQKVCGKSHAYWMDKKRQQGGWMLVRYQDITDSLRLIPYEYPRVLPRPEFDDKILIARVLKKEICTYFVEHHVIVDEKKYAIIVPIADEAGNIREVIICVPEEWGLPVEVIEKCMEQIKTGGYKMHFPTNEWHGEKILKCHYPLSWGPPLV